MKQFRVLNLGAGVQSTVVALMIHKGQLPPIHCAIFADTQEEPLDVYKHLDWLVAEVAPSFPVWIRTAGKLGDALFCKGAKNVTIPAFTNGGGSVKRQCTYQYKVKVVERAIRREVLGLKPRQRWPKDVRVEQLFGISLDEAGRSVRVAAAVSERNADRAFASFPLIEMQWTRRDCREYLLDYAVPHKVQRSACVFCPYKSNAEWLRLKTDSVGWVRALEIDEGLRTAAARGIKHFKNAQFLHRTCVPLGEVDLLTPEQKGDQGELAFVSECEGMCGN